MKHRRIFMALLAACVLVGASAPAQAKSWPKLTNSQYDLNGDGKKDKITVTMQSLDEYDSVVKTTIDVNGAKATLTLDSPEGKLRILDINTKDKVKEIAIGEYGPSSDLETYFYGYTGKAVYRIGSTVGLVGKSSDQIGYGGVCATKGDGLVRASFRAEHLQTWWLQADYKLTKTSDAKKPYKLAIVKKSIYPATMTSKVKALVNIKVYASMSTKASTRTIKKGESLQLLGSDDVKWVQIKDKNGKIGYVLLSFLESGEYDDNAADPNNNGILSGLLFAD